MEMEKEEQKHMEVVVEDLEQEQEQEEEETTLLLRKSRTLIDNGKSENNGHVVEESLVAENGDGIEQEIKEVVENGSEAENGEQKTENLVFHDKTEGIWKCRICTWTYGNGSVSVDHIQNHHKLMNIKTLTFEFEGVEYKATYSEEKQIENKKHEGHILESSKEIESADDDTIHEDELEETAYDVEKVVQEQNTHDLFCPNCNSCITRRVILRKRKRRIRVSYEEVKRNKIEAAVVQENFEYAPVPTADDVDERKEETVLIKCLSCFSFFIPNGNGFRLFRKFGEKGVKENVWEEQVPNTKKNWFTSIFASTKQETTVEQGVVGTAENNDTLEGRDEILHFSRQEPASNGKVTIGITTEKIDDTLEQFGKYTNEQLMESKSDEEVQVNRETHTSTHQIASGESAENTISFSQDGLNFLISSSNGSPTPENSTEREISSPKLHLGGTTVAFPHEEQQVGSYIVTESVVEDKNTNTNFISSETGQVYSSEVSQHTITTSTYEVHTGEAMDVNSILSVNGLSVAQGKDTDHTVITINTQPVDSTLILEGIVNATASASALMPGTQNRERTEVKREFGVEIIKSIVYGGLAESITSLSVVSSAAGGNAATLNVLALGMANIIGGLFVICHNLWELRCDRIVQVNNQISNQVVGQRDRYKELLGRRDNFILHIVVSILSYLIFGLVPPIVYGFSFHKSDDREFKLMVVAAASLLCITMLAIGRAYIQRPPKGYFKCVLNFFLLGVMVSGVSYAGGVLIERLLVKLHLFEPNSVSGLLLDEMTQTHPAWASN
ncbi:hypothetical protein ACJIZ3_003433 [Penstemon smallii]|uniref:C2H2-type domain-containing protein n=1 Tax=Penstemon smallii TaxID=265156 RepID=A0ABD3UAP0_9LAMI